MSPGRLYEIPVTWEVAEYPCHVGGGVTPCHVGGRVAPCHVGGFRTPYDVGGLGHPVPWEAVEHTGR